MRPLNKAGNRSNILVFNDLFCCCLPEEWMRPASGASFGTCLVVLFHSKSPAMIAQEKGGIPRRPFTKRLSYLSYIPKLSSVCAQPQRRLTNPLSQADRADCGPWPTFLGLDSPYFPSFWNGSLLPVIRCTARRCKMMVELISLILASHGTPRGHLELQDFDVVNCSREPSLFPVKAN